MILKSRTTFLISFHLLLLLSIGVFSACMSIKPGAEKSAKKLYETFYVGDEGTQYFIKPLSFQSTENNSSIDIDFAFRYKTSNKGEVIVNYTISDNVIIRNIDSLKIQEKTTTISCLNNKLLFNEKKSKVFISRYSSTISLEELNLMMKNGEWKITVYENSKQHSYISSNKAKSSIKKLNNDLFVIF